MRKQSALAKQRAARDEKAKRNLSRAVEFKRNRNPVAYEVQSTGIQISTCDKFKTVLISTDKASLKKLLNPVKKSAGRRSVIIQEKTI